MPRGQNRIFGIEGRQHTTARGKDPVGRHRHIHRSCRNGFDLETRTGKPDLHTDQGSGAVFKAPITEHSEKRRVWS